MTRVQYMIKGSRGTRVQFMIKSCIMTRVQFMIKGSKSDQYATKCQIERDLGGSVNYNYQVSVRYHGSDH
jgi:hypothetical protein